MLYKLLHFTNVRKTCAYREFNLQWFWVESRFIYMLSFILAKFHNGLRFKKNLIWYVIYIQFFKDFFQPKFIEKLLNDNTLKIKDILA